jgi:hypothetical protein
VLKQNSIDWNKLPFKDAIKTVKGNGKRELAIFSDLIVHIVKIRGRIRQIKPCNNLYVYLSIKTAIDCCIKTDLV